MTTYPDPEFNSIPNREVWSESPFGAPGAEAAKRLSEERPTHTDRFRLVVTCEADSLAAVKNVFAHAAKCVERHQRDELSAAGGGGGAGMLGSSYYIKLTSPTRSKIAALRAEADRLERELNGEDSPK